MFSILTLGHDRPTPPATPPATPHIPLMEIPMKYTTDTRVRREVERAVEGVLDKWATGDSKAETATYVTKLK